MGRHLLSFFFVPCSRQEQGEHFAGREDGRFNPCSFRIVPLLPVPIRSRSPRPSPSILLSSSAREDEPGQSENQFHGSRKGSRIGFLSRETRAKSGSGESNPNTDSEKLSPAQQIRSAINEKRRDGFRLFSLPREYTSWLFESWHFTFMYSSVSFLVPFSPQLFLGGIKDSYSCC